MRVKGLLVCVRYLHRYRFGKVIGSADFYFFTVLIYWWVHGLMAVLRGNGKFRRRYIQVGGATSLGSCSWRMQPPHSTDLSLQTVSVLSDSQELDRSSITCSCHTMFFLRLTHSNTASNAGNETSKAMHEPKQILCSITLAEHWKLTSTEWL